MSLNRITGVLLRRTRMALVLSEIMLPLDCFNLSKAAVKSNMDETQILFTR